MTTNSMKLKENFHSSIMGKRAHLDVKDAKDM
jgi:hypothetical protein